MIRNPKRPSNDEDAYYLIRKGVIGGLSNVQHRVNLSGITKILKNYI